jgi:hypothetical protein
MQQQEYRLHMVVVEGRQESTSTWSVRIESICICLSPVVCLCAIILRRLVRLMTWLGIRSTESEEIPSRLNIVLIEAPVLRRKLRWSTRMDMHLSLPMMSQRPRIQKLLSFVMAGGQTDTLLYTSALHHSATLLLSRIITKKHHIKSIS